MKGQDWTRAVVQHLRVLKMQGHEFGRAWSVTMTLFPPDSRARTSDEGAESQYEFFHRVCEDAWFNRNPGLQGFCMDLAEFAHGPSSDAWASKRKHSRAA
jgi:hypothetical protein